MKNHYYFGLQKGSLVTKKDATEKNPMRGVVVDIDYGGPYVQYHVNWFTTGLGGEHTVWYTGVYPPQSLNVIEEEEA